VSTEIKFWQISNDHIAPVEETSFATNHLEAELENWIVECPDILGQNLLIIARQKNIESVGQLDLLAIDAKGELVIIELKRDLAPRDAVAQVLHYASWLDEILERDVLEIAEDYLKRSLAEVFTERFDSEMPAIVPQSHRILIVAARLDAAAERIINYLARRAALDINALFFRYAKLSSGAEILARSVLVADSVLRVSGAKTSPSVADLIGTASKRQVLPMVAIFRTLRGLTDEYVWEQPAETYGGSFRFWCKNPEGGHKMVFGLNVSGARCATPNGQLDLWIPVKSLAQVLGVPEDRVKEMLKSLPVLKMESSDCIVRLKNQQDADDVSKKIRDWFETSPVLNPEEVSAT